jgi:ZIP family zinc transporter
MIETLVVAIIATSSLAIGAELAFALRPTTRVIGLVMAFGAGALISAVAFELVLDNFDGDQPQIMVVGMAAGALAFFVGDLAIDRMGGQQRKSSTGVQSEGSPLAIVLGAALDGIPESIVLGINIVAGGEVGIAFVVATFLSNLPESMAASSGLVRAGWRRTNIRGLWLIVIGASIVAALVGYLLASSGIMSGGFVPAFAAGAILTMLADTMMPEAYEDAGPSVGLVTVAGFLLAFFLSAR